MNPETDLTTIAAVKDWASIDANNNKDNTAITALIKACSADFLRATNRPDLLAADYTEVRQGDGGSRVVLYHWPINSITSLAIGGATIPESTDKIAAGYYIDVDIDPERVFNVYLNGSAFTDGAPVQIAYNAGYATIPYDITQAVTDWVVFRYRQLPNLGQTEAKSTEGESVQQVQDDAPATVKAVIERYRRALPSVNRRRDQMAAVNAAVSERRVPRR